MYVDVRRCAYAYPGVLGKNTIKNNNKKTLTQALAPKPAGVGLRERYIMDACSLTTQVVAPEVKLSQVAEIA